MLWEGFSSAGKAALRMETNLYCINRQKIKFPCQIKSIKDAENTYFSCLFVFYVLFSHFFWLNGSVLGALCPSVHTCEAWGKENCTKDPLRSSTEQATVTTDVTLIQSESWKRRSWGEGRLRSGLQRKQQGYAVQRSLHTAPCFQSSSFSVKTTITHTIRGDPLLRLSNVSLKFVQWLAFGDGSGWMLDKADKQGKGPSRHS